MEGKREGKRAEGGGVNGGELSDAIYEGNIEQEGVTVYMEQGSPKFPRFSDDKIEREKIHLGGSL